LALRQLANGTGADVAPAERGIVWLLGLQNRDGGMPTFCRGFGKLPFDRSSPDLSAHALRAWFAWLDDIGERLQRRLRAAIRRAIGYVLRVQQPDGAWVPLWFGNQQALPAQHNRLYGTSRVLLAIAACRAERGLERGWVEAGERGLHWLLRAQHTDGGFGAEPGCPTSIEETALGLEALAAWRAQRDPGSVPLAAAIDRAATWLSAATKDGTEFPPSPIGLYFAKLWYSEDLYPLAFTVAALTHANRLDVV
jgi:squalene-hopene/tetraprenyl-beta-curcumene cyclase